MRPAITPGRILASAAICLLTLCTAGLPLAAQDGPEPSASGSAPARDASGSGSSSDRGPTDAQKAAAALSYQAGNRGGDSTPRRAFRQFLSAAEKGRYQEAASFLDVREFPDAEPAELARRLHTIVERRLPVNPETLSGRPQGASDDELPEGVDLLGTVETKAGSTQLLLQRVPGPEGKEVWQLSRGSVGLIDELYAEVSRGPIAEYLPDPLIAYGFLDIQLWQWIALLLLVLVVWLLSWPIALVAVKVMGLATRRTETTLDDEILAAMSRPGRLLIAVLLFSLGAGMLQIENPGRRLILGLCTGLAVISAAWMVNRLIGKLADRMKQRLVESERASLLTLVPLGRKTAQAAVIILAFLFLLQNLGLNVTGLLAGLGIGGLAVALAAQKTVENFFGGLSIIADQPVRVGDFIKFGDQVGVVEDIGIRSTKIRTLDRTLVAIPNGDFSQMKLENFAHRDMMRFYTVIGVRYETTPEQLRYLLVEIRRLLYAHPRVTPDPARIRFVGFGDFSLNLEIFAYVDTEDWNEFLGIREDLMLRIMDIVESSGTGFAFPSNTTYLARDEGLDEEAREKAARRIQELREKGEIPLPAFSPEMIAELDDTLPWPPEGHIEPPEPED